MDPMNHDPVPTIQVIVVILGARYRAAVDILPTSTILDLKLKIKDELGFSLERQDLQFNREWLENYMQVQNYEIPDGAEINLVLKFCVWIRTLDSRFGFMINPQATVKNLKRMIRRQFVGLPVEKMELRVSGQRNYLDDHAILWTCGILDDTEIYLFRK